MTWSCSFIDWPFVCQSSRWIKPMMQKVAPDFLVTFYCTSAFLIFQLFPNEAQEDWRSVLADLLFCRLNCILKNIQDILTSHPNLINVLYRILMFPWKVDFRIFSMKSVFLYKYCLVHYFQFRIIDGSSSNEKLLKKLMILTLLRLTW